MNGKQNRYKKLETHLTYSLITSALLFALYLIAAGLGVIWLKVVSTILAIALASLTLYNLYVTKELTRQRSLWIAVGAAAIIICTLMSLILNYPSPAIY